MLYANFILFYIKIYINDIYIISIVRKDFQTLFHICIHYKHWNIPKLDYKRIELFPVLL